MKNQIRIIKKGEDDGNLTYWLSLSYEERLTHLEQIRQQVIKEKYGDQQRFQRVYKIVKRA